MDLQNNILVLTKKLEYRNTNDLVVFFDKMEYLNVLNGMELKTLFALFRIVVDYNSLEINLSDFKKQEMAQYIKAPFNSVSQSLSSLRKAGFLIKLTNNISLYNPFIFCYADSRKIKEFQNMVNCEFDSENRKIIVKEVTINNQTFYIKPRTRKSKKDVENV